LTAAPCFCWLANHNDSSRWFAISSFPPICSPHFSFLSGVGASLPFSGFPLSGVGENVNN
jgi:hypothetical protein